jgi:hypothetical protein
MVLTTLAGLKFGHPRDLSPVSSYETARFCPARDTSPSDFQTELADSPRELCVPRQRLFVIRTVSRPNRLHEGIRMSPDLAQNNARLLRAWPDQGVKALLGFYAFDVIYKDPQVPDGLRGREQFTAYLNRASRKPRRGVTSPTEFGRPAMSSAAAGFARSIQATGPRLTYADSIWSCLGEIRSYSMRCAPTPLRRTHRGTSASGTGSGS